MAGGVLVAGAVLLPPRLFGIGAVVLGAVAAGVLW